MTRHRWMKFWPQDWRSDPALRTCSLAARGLWIEMITLAHEATPYGHVLIAGRPPSCLMLARALGATESEVAACLAELEAAGVFSFTPDRVVYSRRMVRDGEVSEAGRSAVGKRLINPTKKDPSRGASRVLASPPSSLEDRSRDQEAKAEKGVQGETSLPAPPEDAPPADAVGADAPASPPTVPDAPPPPAKPKRSRITDGTRMTADWLPSDETRAWARAQGARMSDLTEFRDYWLSVPGSKGKKLDWDATLRVRIHELRDRGRIRPPPPAGARPQSPNIERP